MLSDDTSNQEMSAGLDLRLKKVEAAMDKSSGLLVAGPASWRDRDEEIDLVEIWNMLWQGKWWIGGITFLFALGSVFYALSLPNLYKAEVVLVQAQEQSGGLGAMAAQYGGLAAMAGINLGAGKSSDIEQAIALIKSWPFLGAFSETYNLKPLVMAVAKWDRDSEKIVFDRDLYDPEAKQWLREATPHRPSEPTSFEVYEVLSKIVVIDHDIRTGLIRLSVEHPVPQLAYEWTGLLVKELNRHFQHRHVREANQNIDYLRSKIDETSLAEMQTVFYRMIESQMKTLMLAEVSGEYLLKTVVPPSLPEKKSGPSRALICILGAILGGLAGVLTVIVLHLLGSRKGITI